MIISERADDHIKKNLKVYSESELEGIDEESLQIRALIEIQTDTKWGVVEPLVFWKIRCATFRKVF